MECTVIHELPDFILGMFMIAGFLRGRDSIIGGSYYALVAGLTFIGSSTVQLLLGVQLEVLEFLAMLIFSIIPERFLATSKGRGVSYISFVSVIFITLLVVAVKKDTAYFRVGTLLLVSIMMGRLYLHPEVAGKEMTEPLALSSGSALLGAIALILGLGIFSSFMYFTAILLLLMVTVEKSMELGT